MLVVSIVAIALVLAPATVFAADNTVTVTNPGTQTSSVGTAVSLQIHATDSASGQTLTYSATGLPAGLSINSSSGRITGTPTSGGTSSVTVTAQDTTGAPGSASFTWTTAGNTVTVTNPGDQTSSVGTAVSLQIHATDSASGEMLTYNATGLPSGLSIDSSSGLITGTPTTADTSSVTVTANDTTGASDSASFTSTVNSAAGNSVTVTNPGDQTSTVGTAVSLQVHAIDSASGEMLTYNATGLPSGLSIDSSSGLITGTPTTADTSSVTVTAQDTTGASGNASFTWTVNPISTHSPVAAPPTVTITSPTTTTPTPPVGHVQTKIAGISVTGSTIVWCRGAGCQYPPTRVRFALNRATSVRLVLQTRVHGHWKQVATTQLHGHPGVNRDRIAGRWHGRLVPAGPVRILVQIQADDHWRTAKTIGLTVRHIRRRR